MLTHLEPQDPKNGKKKGRAKYPVKARIFWPDGVGRRQGAQPLSPTERRDTPSAMPRPGGPWPDLGAMLAHLGAMLAYLEGNVGPSWGYVGPSWAMLAHLGAMLAHLGAMLPHLGAMLAHLGGYVGPSCGLCWPMLTHLEPQDPKNWRRAQNTVKRGGFWRHAVYGGRGRSPSLLRRGEKRLRQAHGQGAPGRI